MAAQPEPRPVQATDAMDSASPRTALRLIKVVISLGFYVLTEAWRATLRIFGKRRAPNVVVIYYHHVPDEQRESFARQLDHLLKWTTPLSAGASGPLLPDTRYAIVTADDGWKSFADNAVPELARRRIPATLFAIPDRMGQSIDAILFDRLVTADELRALQARGVTIGSHTATHARMTALDEQQARRELRESREKLRAIAGHDIDLFCFPYGEYSDELFPLCREAGYTRIFTCVPALANVSEFALGRVRVDPTDFLLEFHLKLMGAYRWLPMAIEWKRRIFAALGGGARVGAASPPVRPTPSSTGT